VAQLSLLAPQLFPSSAAALAFSVVLFLWPVSEIVGAGIIPLIRRGGVGARRRDRGSLLLIFLGIIISLTVATAFATAGIAMLPSWTCYLGIILMIVGIALRQWSMLVLGQFFSMAVRIQQGQTVVQTGPYRYVRHPSYTGLIIIFVGLGLALQSWGAILALMLIFAVVWGLRIYVEEKALISALGEPYRVYARKTKQLIPYVF